MVRVPEYRQDAALRPVYRQGIEVRATAEAFGADVGTGMQGLAKGFDNLGDALTQVQALEDEATVRQRRDGYLSAKNDLQHSPEAGYLQKQGKAALDGYAGYERDLAGLRQKYSTGLTPAQQRLFDGAVVPLESDTKRTGMIHRAGALKSFVVAVHLMRVRDSPQTFKFDYLMDIRPGCHNQA